MNATLFQFFHWYYSPEGNLWQHAKQEAARLASLGITHVWLPPAYKSALGVDEPGYAVYDLYDLGEFDQKGTVRTRYGTKQEYIQAIDAFHQAGIKVLADVVLNHKMGGEEKEKVTVRSVNAFNRRETTSEPHDVEVNTRFAFPGRQGKYSNYIWDHNSFTGACENDEIKIFLNQYTNGEWEEMLENENGNYDYLMGNDIEFRNPYVREELKRWGCWYAETTGIDGFRLDALKHITPDFYPEWIDHLKNCFKKDFMVIGEYWKSNADILTRYTDITGGRIKLFDVPLHFNFHNASVKGAEYDLRKIFDNTLIKERPELAVPFVDNHDTQPLQALESTVDYWFKPLAYALILLREQGTPCVFYPAMYEAKYADRRNEREIYIELNKVEPLEKLLKVRQKLSYGLQRDYFDDAGIVGWTRDGIYEMENSGCAVLLSNNNDGEKWMSLGERNAGKVLIDICGKQTDAVTLNEKGEGLFKVSGRAVSVWIDEQYKNGL
jgi:alpha-amylase